MGLVGEAVGPEKGRGPRRDSRAHREVAQAVLPMTPAEVARHIVLSEPCRKGPPLKKVGGSEVQQAKEDKDEEHGGREGGLAVHDAAKRQQGRPF